VTSGVSNAYLREGPTSAVFDPVGAGMCPIAVLNDATNRTTMQRGVLQIG